VRLSDITVTNISPSFTHDMTAKTSWHSKEWGVSSGALNSAPTNHSKERNYVIVTLGKLYVKNVINKQHALYGSADAVICSKFVSNIIRSFQMTSLSSVGLSRNKVLQALQRIHVLAETTHIFAHDINSR